MPDDALQPWFRKMMLQILSKALAVFAVAMLGFIAMQSAKLLGGTHPVAVFGIGAAVTMLLILLDGIKSNKASKLQWVALGANVALLIYVAMMLPTKEAIDTLNQSGVTQNHFEAILKWYRT